MDAQVDGEKKESRASGAYWSSAYFFSVAILYLWGYWSPFHINVLEFVSLSDVVKTAAYPIASVFVFMAVGALAGEFSVPEGLLPPGGGANTLVGVWLRRAAPLLFAAYALAIVGIYVFGSVEKWRILPVLLAIPVSFGLKEAGALRSVVRSERARSTVLFLFATLPPFAFGHGTLMANDIISGKTYSYVISEVHGHVLGADTKPSQRLRYIGKAGEQYFLYAPETKSVLVLPMAEAKGLELKTEISHTYVSAAPPASAPADASSTAPGGKH